MSVPAPALPRTGRRLGCAGCLRCGLVSRLPAAGAAACPRCGSRVSLRKPDSVARTSALLAAAAILYLPANLLPIMETTTVMGTESDTIMRGVVVLVNAGSWPLGVLVFFASVVVPLLKLIGLSLLVVAIRLGRPAVPAQATRLYRLIEFVGRWSMLDVYVLTLLVGLVQVQSLATIRPGPGALAFGAVVVLTMLATLSLDPRLLWDRLDARDEHAP